MKNGTTSAGRTRWRCRSCGSSQPQSRPDVTRRAQLDWFIGWLLDGKDPAHLAGSDRSFRRQTQWCWRIEVPPPVPTGQIHDVVMLDGTYFQNWCVLIGTNGRHVIDWQWCDTEKKIAWAQILERRPPPRMVVIDGGSGLHAALREHWPTTRVQRCYFHIFQTVRRHTTFTPRLEAGREILALTRTLMAVKDLDHAAAWLGSYATWEARWDAFLAHRTHARPDTARPRGISLDQRWWYTHRELRKTRGLFRSLIRNQHLFTWLELAKDTDHIWPRTTSPLEGGPNRAIKDLLREHRGMPAPHARRAVDWMLDSLTETPRNPWDLAGPRARTHPGHQLLLGRRQRPPTRLGRPIPPMTRPPHTHNLAYNPAMGRSAGMK